MIGTENTFAIDQTATLGQGVVLSGRGKIGANVHIGHYCIIDGDIEIGAGTSIDPHTVIRGKVRMGQNNRISSFCSIGVPPQHPDLDVAPGGQVSIGSGNVLREYVTIHMPTVDSATAIGNNCYIMVYCDVGHDASIGDYVKMASGCSIAGHCRVDNHSYLGLHVSVHQRRRIGAYSMVGMNSTVMKNVLPYSTIINQTFPKINKVGLEKCNFSEHGIQKIIGFYRKAALNAEILLPTHAPEPDPWLQPIFEFCREQMNDWYLPQFN